MRKLLLFVGLACVFAGIGVPTEVHAVWAFESIGAIGTGDTSGDIDIAYPSGINAGDLLALGFMCHTGGDDLVLPSGWSVLRANGPRQHGLFGIIADGTETGNLTVSIEGAMDNKFMGVIARFSGAPATITGIEHAGTNRTENIADIPTPALTITVDNTLVISVGGKQLAVSPYTPPAGFTEIADGNFSASSLVFGYQIQTTKTNIIEDIWDSASGGNNNTKSIVTSLIEGIGCSTCTRRRQIQ